MSELSPEAQALLELSREGDEPTGEDRARMKRKLAAQIAAAGAVGAGAAAAVKASGLAAKGAALGGAGAAVASTAGVGIGVKIVATIAVIGAVAGGTVVVREATKPAPQVAMTTATAPVVKSTAVPVASPVASAGPLPIALPVSSTGSSPLPLPLPSPSPSPSTTTTTTTITTTITTSNATASSGARATAGPAAPRDTLAEETALLRDARDALSSGEASRALSLLDQHARTYPRGALGEEREGTRVLALCAAGREAEAKREGERFLREHPRSPMTARVRASCGGQ